VYYTFAKDSLAYWYVRYIGYISVIYIMDVYHDDPEYTLQTLNDLKDFVTLQVLA